MATVVSCYADDNDVGISNVSSTGVVVPLEEFQTFGVPSGIKINGRLDNYCVGISPEEVDIKLVNGRAFVAYFFLSK
jgi:hypothetical protein